MGLFLCIVMFGGNFPYRMSGVRNPHPQRLGFHPVHPYAWHRAGSLSADSTRLDEAIKQGIFFLKDDDRPPRVTFYLMATTL
jgi:hypothetical protein